MRLGSLEPRICAWAIEYNLNRKGYDSPHFHPHINTSSIALKTLQSNINKTALDEGGVITMWLIRIFVEGMFVTPFAPRHLVGIPGGRWPFRPKYLSTLPRIAILCSDSTGIPSPFLLPAVRHRPLWGVTNFQSGRSTYVNLDEQDPVVQFATDPRNQIPSNLHIQLDHPPTARYMTGQCQSASEASRTH